MKKETQVKYADVVYDIVGTTKEPACIGSKDYNRQKEINNNLIPVLNGLGVITKAGRGQYVRNTKGRFSRAKAEMIVAKISNYDLLADPNQQRTMAAIRAHLVRNGIIYPVTR